MATVDGELPSFQESLEYTGERDLSSPESDIGHQYMGMAIAGVIYEASAGNISPTDIYRGARSGGLYGISVMRLDDLVDGDNGFPEVKDWESMLDNYIESVEEGEVPEPVEHEEELTVYRAGKLLHDTVQDEQYIRDLVFQLKDLQDVFERAHTEGDYETRLNVAGMTGETLGTLLSATTSFEPDTENMAFCYDVAVAGQVCDDIRDREDVDADLEKLREDSLERLEGYERLTGKALTVAAQHYSSIGETVRSLEGLF